MRSPSPWPACSTIDSSRRGRQRPWWATVLLALSAAAPAADLTSSLVQDGGFETWQSVGPGDGWWKHLQSTPGVVFTLADGRILRPGILSQLFETRRLEAETASVHAGTRALRLEGQMYLAPASPEAYATHDGDLYLAHFWARGPGTARLHLHVYGEGQAHLLATKGEVRAGVWTLIEERFQISGRAPTTIYPRLQGDGGVLIDDLVLNRVLRPGERRPQAVPADLQSRCAFAARATAPIAIDGRLDEPDWATSVRFGGFRAAKDQAQLAAGDLGFRVLTAAEGLYIGVEVPLAEAPAVLDDLKAEPLAGATPAQPDTYTDRESVELFLMPPGSPRYIQLVASLDGYRYDGDSVDKAAWNGRWTSAASVGPDCWTLEVRIPWSDLGVAVPPAAAAWRLNLCVNSTGGSGVSTWAAVGGNFHNPDGFGSLHLAPVADWLREAPGRSAALRQGLVAHLADLGPEGAARLAAVDALVPSAAADDVPRDWQAVARLHARVSEVEMAYLRLAEEIRFIRMFP